MTGERFIWDYWHVPSQYTLLRTPAYEFFPAQEYRRFHEALVRWGRENLGCHDVSPTWLSCYVDGCKQGVHADAPHGPWAFVFSITDFASKKFTGGETFLFRESALDYWNRHDLYSPEGTERRQLIEHIEPRFNRLVVFDPRIPHGVTEVRGPHDVCEGRLVIHGWFVNPKPFVVGPLPFSSLTRELKRLEKWMTDSNVLQDVGQGLLSVRFRVQPSGRVSDVRVLCNSLQGGDAGRSALLQTSLQARIQEMCFKAAKSASTVVLPFTFTTG